MTTLISFASDYALLNETVVLIIGGRQGGAKFHLAAALSAPAHNSARSGRFSLFTSGVVRWL